VLSLDSRREGGSITRLTDGVKARIFLVLYLPVQLPRTTGAALSLRPRCPDRTCSSQVAGTAPAGEVTRSVTVNRSCDAHRPHCRRYRACGNCLRHTDAVAIGDLILCEGDAVRASGQVIFLAGGAWFEPLLPEPPVAHRGPSRPPSPSPFAVPVVGVQKSLLGAPRNFQGGVAGLVALSGTWRGEALRVVTQDALQVGALKSPLGPTAVNGRTPTNPVEAADVRWTEWGVTLMQHSIEWLLLGFSQRPGPRASVAFAVTAARVTTPFASWADALPAGVLKLEVWLGPQRTSESSVR